MSLESSTINTSLSPGEASRYAFDSTDIDAIRVDLSGNAAPYTVDIQTAPNFNSTQYDTCLPSGPVEYTDTHEHTTASLNVGETVRVVITNKTNSTVGVSGSISTHSKEAETTPQDFATSETGHRALAYIDGRAASDHHSATVSEIAGGIASTPITDIVGANLSVDGSNTLNATGGVTDHDNLTGVDPSDHHSKTSSASELSDVSPDSTSDAHHSKTSSASELSDVSPDSTSDAHHTRYTDSEARTAVDGANIDITGDADTVDGQDASQLGGAGVTEAYYHGGLG